MQWLLNINFIVNLVSVDLRSRDSFIQIAANRFRNYICPFSFIWKLNSIKFIRSMKHENIKDDSNKKGTSLCVFLIMSITNLRLSTDVINVEYLKAFVFKTNMSSSIDNQSNPHAFIYYMHFTRRIKRIKVLKYLRG